MKECRNERGGSRRSSLRTSVARTQGQRTNATMQRDPAIATWTTNKKAASTIEYGGIEYFDLECVYRYREALQL